MAFFTSLSLLAGGGAIIHGIYRRGTTLPQHNRALSVTTPPQYDPCDCSSGAPHPFGSAILTFTCLLPSSPSCTPDSLPEVSNCNTLRSHGAMLGIIELASERVGDPADEDAAAKQVPHTLRLYMTLRLHMTLRLYMRGALCLSVGAQAAEQGEPSILDAAVARNRAIWPEFIVANLNRLNSYVFAHSLQRRSVTPCEGTRPRSRKRLVTSASRPPTAGKCSFSCCCCSSSASNVSFSGLLARAIVYALPAPVLVLLDPTVTPACFLLATAVFYTLSYRAGDACVAETSWLRVTSKMLTVFAL
jgi:hypothetical protein